MSSKVFGATLMDFDPLIQRKRERFEQLEREIADPKLFDNRKRAGETMREHANIKTVLAKWDELGNARKQLDDNRELTTSRDIEIAAMADDEIPDLEKRVAELERDLQIALLPPDENENRDAIVEFALGPAGAKPLFSRARSTACITAPPSRPGCKHESSSR